MSQLCSALPLLGPHRKLPHALGRPPLGLFQLHCMFQSTDTQCRCTQGLTLQQRTFAAGVFLIPFLVIPTFEHSLTSARHDQLGSSRTSPGPSLSPDQRCSSPRASPCLSAPRLVRSTAGSQTQVSPLPSVLSLLCSPLARGWWIRLHMHAPACNVPLPLQLPLPTGATVGMLPPNLPCLHHGSTRAVFAGTVPCSPNHGARSCGSHGWKLQWFT